jgi:hypothetical protein
LPCNPDAGADWLDAGVEAKFIPRTLLKLDGLTRHAGVAFDRSSRQLRLISLLRPTMGVNLALI